MVDLFLFVFCFLLLPFLLILCKKNGNSANDRSKASQASMEESGTESEQPSVVISCITLREDDSKMGKVSEIKETKSQRQLTATERCAMEAALNVQHMNKEYPKFEEYCKTHRCVRGTSSFSSFISFFSTVCHSLCQLLAGLWELFLG